MKAMMKKAAALGITLVLGCSVLSGCGKKGSAIDPAKTLMTVNGEDVRLGVGSFFAKYQQAQIYQFYSMYFGGAGSIFDSVSDEETGATYGDTMKDSVLSDLKKMMVIAQHAEEYEVSLSDEETEQIEAAAQAYIDGNDEEILKKIGAEKEDVVKLMTLQTLQAKMMDPIVKDVDTDVPDEEAQQTTVTYVRVDVEEETESVAESEAESAAESEAESVAESEAESAAESEAESAAESEAESAAESVAESEAEAAADEEETAAQSEAREYAEAILDALKEEADIEAADMDAVAKTIDADYYSVSGHFTTSDPTDTTMDASIVDAVKDLTEDHTLVDHVVKSEDGNTYFVVRLDHINDETQTESKKSTIIRERKQELYDETVDGWVEAAEITVDEDAWKLVEMKDSDPITLKAAEAESTAEEEAESAAEEAASEVVSAAEEAASEAVSAAEEAASEAVSAAEEAASEVVSAAEEAASEAVSAAEEAASEVMSAAEEAASEAE